MAKNMITILENQELLKKLNDNGYGDFIDKLLLNEAKCYTKNSNRINKSGTCRILGIKTKELENILAECRKILEGND